jgi:pimeloyl-ACP methyl ester carboxylesterase
MASTLEVIKDNTITLSDGRLLAYAVYGLEDDAAPTVFYLHGFPGSHAEGFFVHEAALEQGVRIVAPSRPGSNKSTFHQGHGISSYAADVLALADQLSIKRFALIGVSGGGPYALACFHSIPRDRLAGIGLVAPMMPTALGTEGMMQSLRAMLWLAPWTPGALGWLMDWSMGAAARDTEHPEKLERLLDKEMEGRPELDRIMYKSHPHFRAVLLRSVRDAMQADGYSAAWEAKLLGSDWGFGLDGLAIEKGQVVIWHGDKDVNVPIAMSRKAVQLMPNAELRQSEGQTHATILLKATEFIETTKDMLSR